MIKAVFFDAGSTLLHPDPPVEEVYAREFSAMGAPASREELDRALTRAWEEVHAESSADRYGGVRGEAEFWLAFLNRVRGHLDGGSISRETLTRLTAHFRDPSSWKVYADVLPALDSLDAEGFHLGVVSNWDSYLPELLGGLQLRDRFRTIAVSAIEETGKPGAEIFRRACDRLGVDAREALHVGDSVREDYEGARAAGLASVLLDRQDRFRAIPDRIRSLAELPPLVSRESRPEKLELEIER